jgi:probable addiction module antidote protein
LYYSSAGETKRARVRTSDMLWIFSRITSNERKKMVNYKDYQEELIEDLSDHDEAVAYLNAAWEESLKGDEESQQLFLLALRNVAEAQGGLGKLARRVRIRREQLYRILSRRGNPGLKIIRALLIALDVNLRFV